MTIPDGATPLANDRPPRPDATRRRRLRPGDAYPRAHGHADPRIHRIANAYAHADPYAHAGADPYPYAYAGADPYAYAGANPDAYTNAYAQTPMRAGSGPANHTRTGSSYCGVA